MRWYIIFLALFILIVNLNIISGITGEVITGETVTGEATSSVAFNITISAGLPTLSILKPENSTYLTNESLLLNYSSTNAYKIWYNFDNGDNITLTSFTHFNISQGSHSLYLYANNTDGNLIGKNVNFSTNITRFTITKSEYEVETEEQRKAKKGDTTDFESYSYEEMQSLDDVILEIPNQGKILFNQAINLTDDANPDDDNIDLDSNINISSNRIEINSVNLPNFNVQATLFFYNLTFSNPRILKDGSVCSTCTQENYSSGLLKFNVTGFTIYTSEETPTATPSSSTGTTSSGGGGATTTTVRKYFSVDKETIKIQLKQGESGKDSITIKNLENYKINITLKISKLDEFLEITEKSFELEIGQERAVSLEFSAGEETYPSLYIGEINVQAEGISKKVLIAVEIESKKHLFDVKLEIPRKFLQVNPGSHILANITLHNLQEIGTVDVNVEYLIKDNEGNIIIKNSETLGIETKISFLREFNLPLDINPEKYMLYVKLTYNGEIASASAWFSVTELFMPFSEITVSAWSWLLTVIVILIIILILIILHEIRKMKKQIKKLGKIDENTLVKEKLIKTKRR